MLSLNSSLIITILDTIPRPTISPNSLIQNPSLFAPTARWPIVQSSQGWEILRHVCAVRYLLSFFTYPRLSFFCPFSLLPHLTLFPRSSTLADSCRSFCRIMDTKLQSLLRVVLFVHVSLYVQASVSKGVGSSNGVTVQQSVPSNGMSVRFRYQCNSSKFHCKHEKITIKIAWVSTPLRWGEHQHPRGEG